MSARMVPAIFLIFGLLWAASPRTSSAQESENPFASREILVFTPTWSNPDEVPPFLQEKVAQSMLSPGCREWKFLQVGYIPLYLRTHIQKTENNFTYTLTVTLRSGEEILRMEDACEICNTAEALEKLSALRDRLCARLEEKAAVKPAEPAPPENTGTPEKPATPPAPRIVGKLDAPKPFSMPPFSPAPPPVKLWTWMGTSLAVASLVTGVVLLAMDGDPTCDAPFPKQQCKERYATGAAGVSFLLVGLAGASLGGWKLYDMYFSPSPGVRVVPAAEPGKASLLLEWRF